MAYYDKIARKWHEVTGFHGGALKKYVLNDVLMAKIGDVGGRAVLELGAGNGYFLPLLLRRYSGHGPARVVVTDASASLLDLAQRHFAVPGAEYLAMDIQRRFPLEDAAFDLVLATMVFNEVRTPGLRQALRECRRVLRPGGKLLATVTHPEFVESLARREELRTTPHGTTMPGAEGLQLPVVARSIAQYETLFAAARFAVEHEPVFPTEKVINEKPGLRLSGRLPLALVFAATRA
jgi:ubiquinone/menaquinone biosynthesis C-methylase UbiE